jgi:hypothetical protein
MEFRSNRLVGIFAGLVTGAISAFNLAFFYVYRQEGVDWFIGFIGFLFLLISAVCFTYSTVVRIDRRRNLVEKITQALFLKKGQIRRVSSFRGVSIIKAAGSSGGRPNMKYFVKLRGSKNMSIPGLEPEYEYALMKAREIAQFLNLPVDEKPRTEFVWT